MADRIEWFSVTVPAGTPKASPLIVPCVFVFGTVTEIDIKVPPGPSGTVGFFVGAGGSQYVPRTVGSYVVPDSDYITWPLDNAINSGSWSVTIYNTGNYPHTIQFGFIINEVGDAHLTPSSQAPASSQLLDNATANVVPPSGTPLDPLSVDYLIASASSELAVIGD